jgi:hypothetical protein
MKALWTALNPSFGTGYRTVWEEVGRRLPQHGIEMLDFSRSDWDLCIYLGYPKAFLLGRDTKREDVVWHTMWETDDVPAWWIELLNRGGMVWVPSEFCAETMVDGGVDVPISIGGYGVNGDVFGFTDRSSGERLFTYLAVGRVLGDRKGAIQVVNTFVRLKERGQIGVDTQLIVKLSDSPFDVIVVGEKTRDDITIINRKVQIGELARLYQSADVFVYPSRGEGFGLEPLEAMACGCCAVVAHWGGMTEYTRDVPCLRLPVHSTAPSGLPPFDSGEMAVIEAEDLSEQMAWCYEHRDRVRAIGAEAADAVRERWNWDIAARRAAELLINYYESL